LTDYQQTLVPQLNEFLDFLTVEARFIVLVKLQRGRIETAIQHHSGVIQLFLCNQQFIRFVR